MGDLTRECVGAAVLADLRECMWLWLWLCTLVAGETRRSDHGVQTGCAWLSFVVVFWSPSFLNSLICNGQIHKMYGHCIASVSVHLHLNKNSMHFSSPTFNKNSMHEYSVIGIRNYDRDVLE